MGCRTILRVFVVCFTHGMHSHLVSTCNMAYNFYMLFHLTLSFHCIECFAQATSTARAFRVTLHGMPFDGILFWKLAGSCSYLNLLCSLCAGLCMHLSENTKNHLLPCWNTEVQSCHPRRDPNLQSALHWSFYTEVQQQCMDSCTFTTTGNIALCTHSTAATELCTRYIAIKNLCSADFHNVHKCICIHCNRIYMCPY